ncbi:MULTISPECIES: hypothetical protein [Salinibacter]|jgi:hypothetical protein|uniref:hypothetical protein n=1 Tax=Salinibacter TaxID=146918 RepID=UPI0021692506|nr:MULTISPECIES: hypothetical protein [Salinibacter]MCS3698552.1 hypothetical protein [Salinibacter ruber]
MPKKSDRPEHESAMSSLLPDVSLDEGSGEEDSGQSDREEELKDSSSKEEKNYSSTKQNQELRKDGGKKSTGGEGPSPDGQDSSRQGKEIPVVPKQRPELAQKLGPYVSDEVDEALEEAYLVLRRRFGNQASKSLIVEAALRYFLSDCLNHGEESEAADWMRRVLGSD